MSRLSSLTISILRPPKWLSASSRDVKRINLNRCISTTYSCKSAGRTVDEEELAKFDSAAVDWWSSSSPLANPALHTLNAIRVPLVRNVLVSQRALSSSKSTAADSPAYPLRGFTVLDVGCGGGILSEPLARLGAQVTGLDASTGLIDAAKWHSSQDPEISGRINYICSTVEDLCSESDVEQFDGVVASEVIEHVADTGTFVASCCRLVKPGGSLFFTTINRTWLSYALAIASAEYIFRVLPPGTHDWNKFISPQEIERLLLPDFSVRLVNGLTLNPLNNRWFTTRTTAVNYVLHAVNQASKES